ncbi:hypothetical protein SAICODRAFT_66413 [Saitoella complicata NRRL Y-17804]|uniref:MoaB/Mog domain-containing protein n=1 Tax=Saitoella complicata (strain BCRC 22490 / CBS 7301 / JCM 7358 / NBRC 10748 / NRRL Y-17804) TaxID=698492 RepID=A0A0E9NIE7_SAICN|nr:uncharacterized protein SAICODRAFT_66413 [Saitoella complicata NRRL Y-17804]ODQ52072.1 hypothetical protein SAICODRAFT_66413 [Saitoella complicata NRRL Y-17804]GAO49446.1 hypothetical protein G7K_3596-t1 [Saitoella complicata NRRL Y-17804]
MVCKRHTDGAMKVGVLTVSETASRDATTDRSGPVLVELFESDPDNWAVTQKAIVPDDIDKIRNTVKEWCDTEELNLIVTSGGTGFAVTDVTPEAVKPLLEKEAPGLVHGMLASSYAITPFAVMARLVAGVRGQTIILTVPGSPKGAKENVEAVLKMMPHACELAAGENSRALHKGGVKQLEEEAGVEGGHAHTHRHDPHHHHHQGHYHGKVGGNLSKTFDQPVTRRHRESPYPMISVTEAQQIIADHSFVLNYEEKKVDHNLVGCVVAEDVAAPENVPAYRASIVDGYAVIASDGRGVYPVVTVSHASAGEHQPLQPGQIARVTTGAPLPPGATAVVMVEDTILKSTKEDGKEENEVEILVDAKDGNNVREIGSDVKAGSVIMRKGEEITSVGGEVGVLASVGRAKVKVYKKPIIGLLSTGNEVVPHDREGGLKSGEIRDSNRPTLYTTIAAWGYPVVDFGIAKDTAQDLESTLRTALEKTDVVITTGGVSMGELDLLKPTIEHSLKGTIQFGRVAMKPGKPTTFATIPWHDGSTKLIFALPGNPASAMVTFNLFILPSLRKSAGYEPAALPKIKVILAESVRLDPRPEYHRAILHVDNEGRLKAHSTGGQRSSRIGSMQKANALLCLPSIMELNGKTELAAGETVDALVLSRLHGSM